jgi:GAF domain-containing protein/HAMP domain-containing protein
MNDKRSSGAGLTGRQVFRLGPSLRFPRQKQKTSLFYTLRARLFVSYLLVALIPTILFSIFNYRVFQQALQNAINLAYPTFMEQVRTILLSGIIVLLLTGLLALIFSRRLTRPITRLTEVADRVSAGDLWAQAPEGLDEIGMLASSFNSMTTELRRTLESLEVRIAERTAELAKASEQMKLRANQLQTVAEVAHAVASEQDLDQLLNTVTRLISQRFGFYHVGIFLVDQKKEFAILRAANSEGGQRMLEHGHRLRVGQKGIVGHATGGGEPRIALDVGADAVFFDNPDLPYTRSEMALPLKVGNEVIGALDVQSMEQSAFSKEEVELLSTLADQVAVAIQTVRLYTETRKTLVELQSMHKQYLQKEWQQEAIEQNRAGFEYSSGEIMPLAYTEFSEKWTDVSVTEPVIIQPDAIDNTSRLLTPIIVRGQVIGMLDLGEPVEQGGWTQDHTTLIQSVADQIGIALENARLLGQSMRRAEREHLVTEITAQMRSSNDPNAILHTAVQELKKALGANQARVIIPTGQIANSFGNGNGIKKNMPEVKEQPGKVKSGNRGGE